MIRIACPKWRDEGPWSRSPTPRKHTRATISAGTAADEEQVAALLRTRPCSCGAALVISHEGTP